MASAIDKLLKFLNAENGNVASFLDEEEQKEIAQDVITGFQIDEDSRASWLKINKDAMRMIKNAESSEKEPEKDFPFYKASKVVYPLIGPAVIQLASRLIQHIVRNNRVAECAVLGKDQPEMTIQQTGNPMQPIQQVPTGFGVKESKAKRVSDFLSYELLMDSDTWLADEHKLCHIVAAWGVAFKECYYDPITKKNCSEIIPPEDVVINTKTQCLDKCRRYTIRLYMTKNEILERIRSGQFLEIDLDEEPGFNLIENPNKDNDSREIQPVYEVLKQFCYYDLDEDGYDEPYTVFVLKHKKQLLGINTAFELQDIHVEEEGGKNRKVLSINPRITLVDRHLIDDPEGNYYSLGLNHLLFHQNKSITTVLRQLLDAGILANTAASSGFVTKAFKTRERQIRARLGTYQVLDLPPGTDIKSQIMNMPFQEPSQVLLALLQFLVESGKETGFMTDILTGDTQVQNAPATSMLAMVEQSTRAFKPVVQKLFISLKKEFKLWFHFHSKYLDEEKYFKFNGMDSKVSKDDFDEKNIDIMPVADPTMSSEAHKFARLRAGLEVAQIIPGSINVPAFLNYYLTQLEYPNAQIFVAAPQPPQPDPNKVIEVQLKQKIAQDQNTIDQLRRQNESLRIGLDAKKQDLKEREVAIKSQQIHANIKKSVVDAHAEAMGVINQAKQTEIEKQNADTEARRVDILAKQSRDSNSSE